MLENVHPPELREDGPLNEANPLQLALEQSHFVKVKVEECAADIGAANGLLLTTRMAGGESRFEAEQALAAGIEVEGKVQECAADLHEVTETLERGIAELEETETAFLASEKALAQTQAALTAANAAVHEARLEALHDSTTGLPNRDLFDSRLEHAISMAKRHGWDLAVMFFDLDRFKSINDTHGHAAGDEVLRVVASRLRSHARDQDTVCRNGGDEFLYLLVNPQGRENIERIARNVAARVAQKIGWKEVDLAVQASIGVAVYPEDGSNGEELVRCADAAMYVAKNGQSGVAFPAHPPRAL